MRRERAPIQSTATPFTVWPVTSRRSRISQRPTSWRSLNAESCHCEPAWNSMINPCPHLVHHFDLGMELDPLRKQSKVAPSAHNHDRACLVPAIIWLARAVNVVRPFSLRLYIDRARCAWGGPVGGT